MRRRTRRPIGRARRAAAGALLPLLSLLLPFSLAGSARAAPFARLTWIATTGTGETGSSLIEASAGDLLTLEYAVLADSPGVIQWSFSPKWDLEGNNILDIANVGVPAIPDGWIELGGAGNGWATIEESEPGQPGTLLSWTEPADLFNTGAPVSLGTPFIVGTLQFLVVGSHGFSTIDWFAPEEAGPIAPSFILDGDGVHHFIARTFLAFVSPGHGHPTATPTATATPSPPTPTVTATPTASATPTPSPPSCADANPIRSIASVGKGQSPSNNPKVAHRITGHIIDPGSLGDTAHRIPVCSGTAVTVVVTDTTGTPAVTPQGSLVCAPSGGGVSCTGVVSRTEKYTAVSQDGRDTDRMALLAD